MALADMSASIRIAVGMKNHGLVKNRKWTWMELVAKLAKPAETPETMAQFLKLDQEGQRALKNVGGYWIAAHCDGGRRARDAIHYRDVLTLDIDTNCDPSLLDQIELGLTPISDFEFVVHSSRKHTADVPRLRVVVPFLEPIPADQYTAVSRIFASKLDLSMALFDKVSFRVAQMMYWPSKCSDGDWFFHHNRGRALDAAAMLEEFGDWQDYTKLPYAEDDVAHRPSAKKAEDPRDKKGIIGAFCRAYRIEEAIEKFIPEIYTPDERFSGGKQRYTFTGGTGFSGAVVEDDGLFLYSHHGTDPCSDKLTNAFDLVRIHLFGELDEGLPENTKPTNMPSYKAMVEMCQEDSEVIVEYSPGLREMIATPIDVEEDFSDDDVPAGEPEAEKEGTPLLDWFNRRHALVMIGGKSVVMTQRGGSLEFSHVADIHNLYANRRVPTLRSEEPASVWWMRQPGRRTYNGGVRFAPGQDLGKDVFNLWTGFAVKPDPAASCELFLRHVREVVCSDNEAHYTYVMGWLAHMIQKPQEKPKVALIMIGDKGVGKDTVGDYVAKLFPRHRTKVAQMDQLVGKFNAHLEKTLLLHVEEGMWGGDKSADGPLKSLITSDQVAIERKGFDAIQMPSVLRLLMTSNEEWVVPASQNERRYAVFNVSDRYARQASYFRPLFAERENGGPAALLHTLQTWDLSEFDPLDVPQTRGLVDQKIAGLKGVKLFWLHVLKRGTLPQEHGFGDCEWRKGPVRVANEALYEEYKQWDKDRRGKGHGDLLGEKDFGAAIQGKLCPLRVKGQKSKWKGERKNAATYPKLSQCRAEFTSQYGYDDWDDEEDDDDDLENLI